MYTLAPILVIFFLLLNKFAPILVDFLFTTERICSYFGRKTFTTQISNVFPEDLEYSRIGSKPTKSTKIGARIYKSVIAYV